MPGVSMPGTASILGFLQGGGQTHIKTVTIYIINFNKSWVWFWIPFFFFFFSKICQKSRRVWHESRSLYSTQVLCHRSFQMRHSMLPILVPNTWWQAKNEKKTKHLKGFVGRCITFLSILTNKIWWSLPISSFRLNFISTITSFSYETPQTTAKYIKSTL